MSVRQDVALVMAGNALAERYACKLLEVDRTTYRYEPRPDRNAELREAKLMLANEKPRYGYRSLCALLARQGWKVNVKRVYRLYKAERLMVRRLKAKAPRPTRNGNPCWCGETRNGLWTLCPTRWPLGAPYGSSR